jgi:16S rRNA (uracil1498-N3)-methyltransferase
MTPRFHVALPLTAGEVIALPAQAARHVQVLRLQPGSEVTLFSSLGNRASDSGDSGNSAPGSEGEWRATIARMGRSEVDVIVGAFQPTSREAHRAVTLAVGMPANDRMDWLIEKATELGAAAIWPLVTERSVLRLNAERADKKRAHWRGVATAACEQCGRNRVPVIHEAARLADWLPAGQAQACSARLLLSLQAASQTLSQALPAAGAVTFLSGPEGGLTAAEEALAVAHGFLPVTLGPRVLRAETAPLAVLSRLMLT